MATKRTIESTESTECDVPDVKKPRRSVVIDQMFAALFRKKLEAAVQIVAKSMGLVSCNVGNITYTSTELRTSLVAYPLILGSDGEVKTEEQLRWDKHCTSLGFTPDDYGKRFVYNNEKSLNLNGDTLILHSVQPQNRKYPILVKCVRDQKVYKMSTEEALKHYKLYTIRNSKKVEPKAPIVFSSDKIDPNAEKVKPCQAVINNLVIESGKWKDVLAQVGASDSPAYGNGLCVWECSGDLKIKTKGNPIMNHNIELVQITGGSDSVVKAQMKIIGAASDFEYASVE